MGGCLVALTLTAATAFATADRLDYADQANPLCKSSNKQMEDLYESTEAEIDRLYDLHPTSRKKAHRLSERRDQLEAQLPFQIQALYQAALDNLKSIAAPPGYESTVTAWLANRQQIATLYLQYLQIEQKEEGGFESFHKRPSRKAIKRRHKQLQDLERQLDQTVGQLLTDGDVDLELGTRMGAAYCVTGATGELPSSVAIIED